MRRIIFAATLIALTMAGCKDAVPVADPFVGRTTIPPPPTGAAAGRTPDLNYQPPPLSPPSMPASSATVPPTIQMPNAAMAPSPVVGPTPASPYPSNSPTPSGTNTTPGATPNYYAPRPSSTQPRSAPSIPAPSTGTATSPGGASPYLPPSSNFNNNSLNNRGASWPGTTTAPVTNVSTTPNGTMLDNRSPHPIDDATAQTARGGQVPIVRTLQPRQRAEASDQPVDILDLPKSP
ncbi:MAG: hypothetical protein ABFC77_12695 [Thermoguttaceae bacterium]